MPKRLTVEPETIGSLLAEVRKRVSAAQIWESEIAPDLPETRLLQMRWGVVSVQVPSSCALFELKGFRQPEILERLRGASIPIMATGIRFELAGAA